MKEWSRTQPQRRSPMRGRLKARPGVALTELAPTGLQPLALDGPRDGLLYVPANYQADHPMPLVIMLHGADGTARGSLNYFLPVLEQAGCLLLVPESRETTWDIIVERRYGPDVDFIDQALTQTFNRYNVDQKALAISGFSDGASYALSLGLINGDLFTHVLAFSPGFLSLDYPHGQPRIFMAHGIHDTVLPIEHCSRRIVLRLQQDHYDVNYHEFDGPHTVPPEIVKGAWRWFQATSEHE